MQSSMNELVEKIVPTNLANPMEVLASTRKASEAAYREMTATKGFQRLLKGELSIEHYKSILKQIYYYTRETPQMLTHVTTYFRGKERKSINTMYRHASSEVGHEQLALNDLEALGEDIADVPYLNPLPETMALISMPIYQMQHRDPIGFLGYLYFLEYMPTKGGSGYLEGLKKIGVPPAAMSFISDHSVIDLGHNKLMERYLQDLVTTPDRLNSIMYVIHVTAKYYGDMISAAIDAVDSPKDWGIDCSELRHSYSATEGETRILELRRKHQDALIMCD